MPLASGACWNWSAFWVARLPFGAARMVRFVERSVVPAKSVRVTVILTPLTVAFEKDESVVKLFQLRVDVVQEAAAAGDVKLSRITGAVHPIAPAAAAARIMSRRRMVWAPSATT